VGGGFGVGGNGSFTGGTFMEGGTTNPSAGSPGIPGVLVIFENNGT
jgi:hypothetical protein